MPLAVVFAPAARRQVRRLPRELQKRVVAAAEHLGTNPHSRGSTKLEASLHLYRVRVGDYRIIYQVTDEAASVTVVKVGHRGSVYKVKGRG